MNSLRSKLRDTVADVRRLAMVSALRKTGGDRKAAAKVCDVSKSTFTRWLSLYPDVREMFPAVRRGRPKGLRDKKPRVRRWLKKPS